MITVNLMPKRDGFFEGMTPALWVRSAVVLAILAAMSLTAVAAIRETDRWQKACIAAGGVPMWRPRVCMKGQTIPVE